MNIYDFFRPSSPISAHLQSIDYNFSPLERAVIIYKSNKSLRAKHEAYRYIIAEYPDMPIPEVHGVPGVPSLHSFLREEIDTEEREIHAFLRPEADAVFFPSTVERDCWELPSDACFGIYTTLDAALARVPKHYWLVQANDGYVIEIQKRYLNQEKVRFAGYTFGGEIADVYVIDAYKEHDLECDVSPTTSLSNFWIACLKAWTPDISPFKRVATLTDQAFRDAVATCLAQDSRTSPEMAVMAKQHPNAVHVNFDQITELEVHEPLSMDDLKWFPNLSRLTISAGGGQRGWFWCLFCKKWRNWQ